MPQPESVHLNDHHRNTLSQIFRHPVGHNIEWRAVLSLLEEVGSVEQRHDARGLESVAEEEPASR
jgi:hypothetical protein